MKLTKKQTVNILDKNGKSVKTIEAPFRQYRVGGTRCWEMSRPFYKNLLSLGFYGWELPEYSTKAR